MPHRKKDVGLTASEIEFNRNIDRACKRLQGATEPISVYRISTLLDGEISGIIARLKQQKIRPRGLDTDNDHAGTTA